MKKRVVLVLASLLIGGSCLTGCNTSTPEKEEPVATEEREKVEEVAKEPVNETTFDWSDSKLVKSVPLPETDKTSIEEDRDDLFWVYINGDKDAFKAYVEQCKEKGFNIDIKEFDDEMYAAYNEDGEHLSLQLDGTQYELVVKASKINGTIAWPNSGMAKLIPNPEKSVGSIVVDSSNQFTAYVGEMSEDEFKAYVEKCIANGFEYDYTKGDKYFSGRNKNGDYIHISYEGVNTMQISMMSMELMDDDWTPPAK